MAHDCLFCRIARGDIPAHRVYEDGELLAFLDIHPIRPGHTLIVPRDHYAYFDDLPEMLAARIMTLGQRLGRAMKAHSGVERAGVLFTGTDIAHVHAHVLPLHERGDITSRRYIVEEQLTWQLPPRGSDESLAATAAELRRQLR